MNFRYLIFLSIFTVAGCDENYDFVPDSVTYHNPLLGAGPDPWVYKKDSFYYYTSTSGDRIELRRTKSVSRLGEVEPKVIWRPSVFTLFSYNIWAPELHYLDKKWYIYYTAGSTNSTSGQRLFVLENSSQDPMEGDWEEKGQLADSTADYFALDGTVLEYNNKRYLLWSSTETPSTPDQNIYIAELKNPWTLATGRQMISSPKLSWEKFDSPPAKGVNEGPQVLKNSSGRVFITYSASECWSDGYGLGLLSLIPNGNPMIPSHWIKKAVPVFSTKSSSNAFGPGHNAFFKSPDETEDWIIYHANSEARQYCGGFRSPRIQKFTWNEDGTPHFGQPVPTFVKFRRPSGEKGD